MPFCTPDRTGGDYCLPWIQGGLKGQRISEGEGEHQSESRIALSIPLFCPCSVHLGAKNVGLGEGAGEGNCGQDWVPPPYCIESRPR